jgi:hypothetical protein
MGVENMAQVNKLPGSGNFGSNLAGPWDPMRYSEIMDWIGDRQETFIGSSYYYIQADDRRSSLFRLTTSGGSLYSIEIVDYAQFGISDDELDEAVRESGGDPEIPNHYPINGHIERKLRTLLDI